MQSKVLPGSSHTVWAYMKAQWTGLLQVSLLPMAVVIAVLIIQTRMMASTFALFAALEDPRQLPPGFMQEMMRGYGWLFVLGILGGFCFVWLFVRIVRLRELGEKPWLGFTKPALTATLMTLIYAIGIYFLTMIAYFAGAVAVLVPITLIAALMASSAHAAGIVSIVLMFPALCAAMAFLIWFFLRLAVGLPAVALGKSPDFMRDMWKLSEGESWGLPLRFAAVYIAAVPAFIAVVAVFYWPVFSDLADLARTPPPPGKFPFEVFQRFIDHMLPSNIVFMLLQLPVIWFVSLLLTEGNRRFLHRRSKLNAAP
jgi:hypothetical protein